MNYNINIPVDADYIIISPQRYYLNAKIESDQITVTMETEILSRSSGEYLSFPLPCCDIDVKHVASKLASNIDHLLQCGAIIFDGIDCIINDPWYVLTIITELNFAL